MSDDLTKDELKLLEKEAVKYHKKLKCSCLARGAHYSEILYHAILPNADEYLERIRDPEKFLAAETLLVQLVAHRINRMTQQEMARAMQVAQSTVSQFEAEGNDPRISTLTRYAEALGFKLVLKEIPKEGRK